MILRRLLEYAALRRPEATALVDGDRRFTYAGWDARVDRVANVLTSLGVRPGDRVVQALKNREENCAVHFACQKVGAVNTPINFRWSGGEIAYCLQDSGARLVVYEEATQPAVAAALADVGNQPATLFVGPNAPSGAVAFEEAVAKASAESPKAEVAPTDTALMLYTSGTTGRPKGVPRSQQAEYAATIGQIVQHRYVSGDRTLGVMPLYHTMGMHSLTAMIALNGTFVAMPDWNPAAALALIEREKLNCLYLVPTLYYQMLRDPALEKQHVSSVRKISYAGAPMLSTLIAECREKLRPDVFINHYGSTEVYTFAIFDDPARKPGCAGRAAFHTALRVVRADTDPTVRPDEVVPPGDTGEIIVSLASDEAFAGYYNRPEATTRAIRDGWYFTGDTGYLDADGDLWVTGRVDDMIITGGENVHPVEVEDVLVRHPGVAEVAVAGLPDEQWGQVVTAFVVPRDGSLTVAALDAHCRDGRDLARFKRPRRFVFVREVPKSPVGKILRRLLVAGEYEALPAGEQE